jgi:hypothetical protein
LVGRNPRYERNSEVRQRILEKRPIGLRGSFSGSKTGDWDLHPPALDGDSLEELLIPVEMGVWLQINFLARQ